MLFKSVAAVPGKGKKVGTFSIGYNPPVPARGENQFWQELEKRLGVTWEPVIAPQASYGEKAAALVAGDDMPELFYINPGQSAAHLNRTIEQGAFTDLTPFLAGDALKEYPNLARFDPQVWQNVRVKGKIYGVPKPIPRANNIPFYRADWAKKLGKAAPKNADEVADFLVALSKGDPDGNGRADAWALGAPGGDWNNSLVAQMFRAPNGWRKNPDGTLTAALETEEYRRAVAFMRRLFEGGAYHPDAATMTWAQMTDGFKGGQIGVHSGGFRPFFGGNGTRGTIKATQPTAEVMGLVPPGHDGGQGAVNLTPGFFGFTGIPAKVGRDRERTRELLRIADYLAAPFGSEEYNFLQFGLEGVHHTVEPDGRRVRTDKGKTERGDLVYLLAPDEVAAFFYPEMPGEAEYAQNLAKEMLAVGVENPTLTLYSPTNTAKATELNQLGRDRITAIVTGREPLGALDGYVKEWRSRGGDEIRKEYEQALKEQ